MLDIDPIVQAIFSVKNELSRPSIVFRPTLTKERGGWAAALGGVIGVGDTPDQAMRAFDASWRKPGGGR